MKQLVFAIGFVAGAALGFVSSSLMSGKQSKAPEENTPKVTKNQDNSRIKDLESQINEFRQTLASMQPPLSARSTN